MLVARIWQFMSENALILTGLIIAAITAIGVFLGPRLTANWQKRQKEQEARLRTHFKGIKNEMENSVIRIISRITEYCGQVVSHSQAIHSEVTEPDLPQFPDSCAAHFPEEKAKLEEFKQRVIEHNKNYECFRLEIYSFFKSKGLPVLAINSKNFSPHIWDNILPPLFNWWQQRDRGEANPSPDFTRIETSPDGGPNNLYASGWSSAAVAYSESEDSRELCRKVIREAAENKNFEKESVKLTRLAKQLVEEIRDWRKQLADNLDNVNDFWPGTKDYQFKKEMRKCPKCQEIFG